MELRFWAIWLANDFQNEHLFSKGAQPQILISTPFTKKYIKIDGDYILNSKRGNL